LSSNKACAIQRWISEDLKQGKKTLLTKSFVEAAIKKFGQPPVIKKVAGINMKWLFDNNGKLIQNKAAYAPYEYDLGGQIPITQINMACKGTYVCVYLSGINGEFFNTANITIISYDYMKAALKIDQEAAQKAKAQKEKQQKEEAEKTKVKF
jgi:hypothetical protein